MIVVGGEEYLESDEAARLLGVKRETLYAYVSRGVLRSYRQGIKRQRLYRRADIDHLLRLAPASGGPGQRLLLKGGVVLTMDPRLGDFENADVLIEGSKIAAVGASLPANAPIVDASNMIVMPGFVDTHHHIWQGQLRNILPNGRLDPDYFRDIGASARNAYRSEDVYVGDLLSAWGAINAGITTLLDWSHISNSPEHSDAAVQGLRESGIRAVYGYGTGAAGAEEPVPSRYPAPAQAVLQHRRPAADARAGDGVRSQALGGGA